MRKKELILTTICLLPILGLGQTNEPPGYDTVVDLPEVVVTATRFAVDKASLATPVSVITRQDLEDTQSSLAIDAIRQVPGVILLQTGGIGRTASVRLRGLSGQQNLVLIDGIELNNSGSASTSEGDFDFGNLTTADIERIEVIRGPQSAVYGADAIGGVINIITRKAVSKEPRVTLDLTGGSFNTVDASGSLSGGYQKLSYRFNGQYFRTDGISAAESATGAVFERDAYKQVNAGAWLRWNGSDIFAVEGQTRFARSEGGFDAAGGTDDPDNTDEDTTIVSSLKPMLTLWDGRWESQLPLSVSVTKGELRDNFSAPFELDNIQPKVNWNNRVDLREWVDVVAGVQWESEQAEINNTPVGAAPDPTVEQSLESWGLYGLLDLAPVERLKLELSARADFTSDFGTEDTYRAAGAYNLWSGARVRAAVGSGFNTPTVAQLYRPFFGVPANNNLRPEKSLGWEVGIDQEIKPLNADIELTYFHNDVKDQITFSFPPGNFQNINRARTRGVELGVDWEPFEYVSFDANYTYTDAIDKTTGFKIQRTPEDVITGGATVKFMDQKLRLRLEAVYYSDRFNRSRERSPMPDHTVWNLGASYQATKNLKVHARVDNLFDRDYQLVQGFSTPPLSAYGGLTLTF